MDHCRFIRYWSRQLAVYMDIVVLFDWTIFVVMRCSIGRRNVAVLYLKTIENSEQKIKLTYTLMYQNKWVIRVALYM